MGPTGSTGPGVRVPPPLIFVAGWVVAWLLHRALPFALDGSGPSRWQTAAGVVALVGGSMLMLWAILTLASGRTPIVPTRPARVLVEQGPYRFSRNPIYVGMALAYGGLAVVLNLAWPLLVLPGVLALLVPLVVRREERHLGATFGDAYRTYQRRVRRWL